MFFRKIRSGVMLVVAFVSCPCHLPITLPITLALLAGTPLAVWITQHSGWLYGVMTGIFLLSLVIGFIWLESKTDKAGEICEPNL
ncbi:MAG: hypothetical protein DCC56_01635 [Anaerolineae bacterium]|nr:MAG: hypothetical protein DCC56_01635 [Anaerolineae bacterium]WKZ44738.1 MAG: hypothetical protein QY302_02980 [Anaerolineales bacterium]